MRASKEGFYHVDVRGLEVLEASPRRLRVRFMGKLWVMESAPSVS